MNSNAENLYVKNPRGLTFNILLENTIKQIGNLFLCY